MIEWMYPVKCPVCGKPVVPKGELIHEDCRIKLDYIEEPLCKKCGVPLEEEEEYCPVCSRRERGWDLGRSVFLYHGVAGRVLRKVKDEGTKEYVRFFAEQMNKSCGDFIRQVAPDCMVPVPLHPSKLRRRGFNQAELLAVALGKETGIPVRLLIKKTKKTKDQKRLNREQRSSNVRGAFEADTGAMGKQIPQSILLVDDVYTTGSTLTACAKVLKAYGVERVAFLSICAGEQAD